MEEDEMIPLATTRYLPLAVKRSFPVTGTVAASGRVELDQEVPRAEEIVPESDPDIELTTRPEWELTVYDSQDIEAGTRVTVLHEDGYLYAKPEPQPSSTVSGEIKPDQEASQK
jgi:hypothetical protein